MKLLLAFFALFVVTAFAEKVKICKFCECVDDVAIFCNGMDLNFIEFGDVDIFPTLDLRETMGLSANSFLCTSLKGFEKVLLKNADISCGVFSQMMSCDSAVTCIDDQPEDDQPDSTGTSPKVLLQNSTFPEWKNFTPIFPIFWRFENFTGNETEGISESGEILISIPNQAEFWILFGFGTLALVLIVTFSWYCIRRHRRSQPNPAAERFVSFEKAMEAVKQVPPSAFSIDDGENKPSTSGLQKRVSTEPSKTEMITMGRERGDSSAFGMKMVGSYMRPPLSSVKLLPPLREIKKGKGSSTSSTSSPTGGPLSSVKLLVPLREIKKEKDSDTSSSTSSSEGCIPDAKKAKLEMELKYRPGGKKLQ